jgi:hypothetical protein
MDDPRERSQTVAREIEMGDHGERLEPNRRPKERSGVASSPLLLKSCVRLLERGGSTPQARSDGLAPVSVVDSSAYGPAAAIAGAGRPMPSLRTFQ